MSLQKTPIMKTTERGCREDALGYIGCKLKVTDSCLTANNREEDKQSQGESERENSLQTYE